MFNLRIVSSLEKILPKSSFENETISELTGLCGETVSFQAVYSGDKCGLYNFEIVGAKAEIYFVENVAVEFATFPEAYADNNYISHEPGLYPDRLHLADRDWVQVNNINHALWISCNLPAGTHCVTVRFKDSDGATVAEEKINIEIIDCNLPKQSLIYTEWFYADCIAAHYGYEIFSQEHWAMIEKYLRIAYKFGINMILTPIFTPPLDTGVNVKRPLTQLVKINKTGNKYTFDFELVKRWIRLCKEIGFTHFEIPHLFTQWGAAYTPRIAAYEDGQIKDIFGWDVAADSVEYDCFLSQFLPELKELLKKESIYNNTYFHISDEPTLDKIEGYQRAGSIAKKYLSGCKIIDTLSDIDFYKKELTDIPIPTTDHIEPFLKEKVKERWCYYCCGQCVNVSNRFAAMPSSRNRSIGVQLYKYKIEGFLHWGFNFYFSQYSRLHLNVFAQTDAYGAFPSGDSIAVYPGENGPMPAIGFVVFHEALQDLCALQLLESYMGYDKTVEFVETALGKTVKFDVCYSASEILRMRKAVNDKLKEFNK